MSGLTTNFSWLVPTNSDPANVAADMGTFLGEIDGSLGNAWTTYTPTWTAVTTPPVLGTGTITGRYKTFGKWGVCNGQLTMGGTTTYGTGAYRFSLPPSWTLQNTVSILVRGFGGVFDTSTGTHYVGYLNYVSGTTIAMRTHAATAEVGTAVPVTFASGDIITWELITELA